MAQFVLLFYLAEKFYSYGRCHNKWCSFANVSCLFSSLLYLVDDTISGALLPILESFCMSQGTIDGALLPKTKIYLTHQGEQLVGLFCIGKLYYFYLRWHKQWCSSAYARSFFYMGVSTISGALLPILEISLYGREHN